MPRQHALRLAQAVGEQHAGLPGLLIGAPPRSHIGQHFALRRPAEDGQPEGGFGDERVAGQRLEWRAGGIGLQLVIARNHPDFAARFDAHLRRAQNMSGGMQRDARAAERYGVAVFDRLDGGFIAQAFAQ